MGSLETALHAVRDKVALAAKKSGRAPGEIQIVAVSKKQPLEKIESLLALGQFNFGENYVQEWSQKKDALAMQSALRWHLIGPLQGNKVKLVVGNCELIQSVDRLSLAEEISRIAIEKKLVQKVLVQVRIGDEDSKHGVSSSEAPALLALMAQLPGIQVCGMMALPPMTEQESEARAFLREGKILFDKWKTEYPHFHLLSLGTSHDFEWAIQEGANMVRVGTILFGSRPV